MTVQDARAFGHIDSLDREVLLAYAVQKDRTWLLAHADYVLSSKEENAFKAMVKRREESEPVAYIIESKDFYGRTFTVHSSVLIPRPATEALVETALAALQGRQVEAVQEIDTNIVCWSMFKNDLQNVHTVVDVGTGSGCIAITLALEMPNLDIIATDISADALNVARANAAMHGVADRIECKEGSLLEPAATTNVPFLLVSNPPYIPVDETLMPDVSEFEPKGALFGGTNGAVLLQELVQQAQKNPYCAGWIIECRNEQAALDFSL